MYTYRYIHVDVWDITMGYNKCSSSDWLFHVALFPLPGGMSDTVDQARPVGARISNLPMRHERLWMCIYQWIYDDIYIYILLYT